LGDFRVGSLENFNEKNPKKIRFELILLNYLG
jgi:hypothetical protein